MHHSLFQFCRKVWLGLYDSRSHMEPDSKDETKIKDFMCQKYEKKRWYVAPTETMHEEARKLNTPEKKETTKPLRTLVGDNVPGLKVLNNVSRNISMIKVIDDIIVRVRMVNKLCLFFSGKLQA